MLLLLLIGGRDFSKTPFTFGQAIEASINIHISRASVANPIDAKRGFCPAIHPFGLKSSIDIAKAGRISMKTAGIAMNQMGRLRRRIQNKMTRKASPPRS